MTTEQPAAPPPPDPTAAALNRIGRALESIALALAVTAEVRLDELAEQHLVTASAALSGRSALQQVIVANTPRQAAPTQQAQSQRPQGGRRP